MNNDKLKSFIKQTFSLDPVSITIYQQALTHRSYLNEAKNRDAGSYERLEFLGDSILSFYVSQIIYHKYPESPEGDLTNLRSTIVKTESLAQLAQQMNLGAYLLLSKGEEDSKGRENESILADCFEAIIAAIFLDQGLTAIEAVLEKLLVPLIEISYARKELKDYKSLLQEVSQENLQVSPQYKVIKTEGPDHHKLFTIVVDLNGKTIGQGKGYSKQKAEQEAAKHALENWEK